MYFGKPWCWNCYSVETVIATLLRDEDDALGPAVRDL